MALVWGHGRVSPATRPATTSFLSQATQVTRVTDLTSLLLRLRHAGAGFFEIIFPTVDELPGR
jgi:hypothetical protein